MDKIIIRDLLIRSILGINPEERENKQEILLNLTLFCDIRAAAASEDIADAVNYFAVTQRIIQHVEASTDWLAEKLITDIARLILLEYDVSRVVVRLEKPGALHYAASVGLEIDRSREDFLIDG